MQRDTSMDIEEEDYFEGLGAEEDKNAVAAGAREILPERKEVRVGWFKVMETDEQVGVFPDIFCAVTPVAAHLQLRSAFLGLTL